MSKIKPLIYLGFFFLVFSSCYVTARADETPTNSGETQDFGKIIHKGETVTITEPVTITGGLKIEKEGNLIITKGGSLTVKAAPPETQEQEPSGDTDIQKIDIQGQLIILQSSDSFLKTKAPFMVAEGIHWENTDPDIIISPSETGGSYSFTFGQAIISDTSHYEIKDNNANLDASEKAYELTFTCKQGEGFQSFPAKASVLIGKANLKYPGSSNLSAYYGQHLSDVKGKLSAGYSFVQADTTPVGAPGKHSFEINYEKRSSYDSSHPNPANYKNGSVTILVEKSAGQILSDDLKSLNVTRANLSMDKINQYNKLQKRYQALSATEKNKVAADSLKRLNSAKSAISKNKLCNNIYYRYSSNTLTVFGKGKMNDLFKTFVLKKKEKQVSKRKFQKEYGKKIKKVVIEKGISYVGKGYFAYLPKLESVKITGAAALGQSTFFSCPMLKKVELIGVSRIGHASFGKCKKLKTLKVEGGLKYLEKAAFSECGSLTSIQLPSTVSIGYGCFNQCVKLKKITFGSSKVTCGKYAFYKAGSKVSKKKRVICYKNKKLLKNSKKMVKMAKSSGYKFVYKK